MRTIRKIIGEDTKLAQPSRSLWELSADKPEIRQIYGHFLPPMHRMKANELIAVDFNFPPTYHAANTRNGRGLPGVRPTPFTPLRISRNVRMRFERGGFVVYTPYFNGFFVNGAGARVVRQLFKRNTIAKAAEELGCDADIVGTFVTRLAALGIVDAAPPGS